MWPPGAERTARTRRGMLCTNFLSLTSLRDSPGHTQFCCRSWRIIHVTDMNRHLVPEVLYGVRIRTFGWPVHDFLVLIIQEIPGGSGCVWRSLILDQDKVLEGGSCPGWETLLQHMCVHLLVHCAVQHNKLTFATVAKSSPLDERWTDITICCPHTEIYGPLTLPYIHSKSFICVMWIESWLVSDSLKSV